MKPNRPRKSHFLPKFYLAGFTASGEVADDLYVFDQSTDRDWLSSPAKAAVERDFYVVDLGPDEDPDVMEKCLAHLEGDFSRVLRNIISQQQLPAGEDFNWLLNFVALMVTRIPRTRKVIGRVIDGVSKEELRKTLATREGWAQFRKVCEAAGHLVADDEFEEFQRVANGEAYSVDFDQTSHVRVMAKEMIDALLPALAERRWALGIATPDAPDFVCSDVPVSVWPARGADWGKPTTLTSPNTVLSFPITRRLVAVARYEAQNPLRVVTAPGVALCNTWTLSDARQVFSATPDFAFLKPDGAVGGKADLREHYRRMRGGT
jgi:Protein of unknown function (DUF4238)